MSRESEARLREAERAAADALDRGCCEDIASIDRFLAGPLREAEVALRDEMASLGDGNETLRRNLLAQAAGSIGERCWDKVFANVALRFRARFSMYADALVAAEERFLFESRNGIELGHGAKLCRLRPRRISLPRVVEPDPPAISLDAGGTESIVLGCLAQLERHLREAIVCEVERAQLRLVRRGTLNLARTHVALRLARPRPPARPS